MRAYVVSGVRKLKAGRVIMCCACDVCQRNDIATAIGKYDQFDFLIDIVPREEIRPTKRVRPLCLSSAALHLFVYSSHLNCLSHISGNKPRIIEPVQ